MGIHRNLPTRMRFGWRVPVGVGLSLLMALLATAPGEAGPAVGEQRQSQAKRLYCGYDPAGAETEWHNHNLNLRAQAGRARDATSLKTEGVQGAEIASTEDVGDVAVLDNDGTLVIPPNKFDLKNRSLLFTPDSGGYRLSKGKLDFETSLGTELDYFFGVGDRIVGPDNGYRGIPLSNGPFPFFGSFYDRVFVGTNGYITFTEGDTTARPSAAAFSSQLPRISPLWSDLDATKSGAIYFNQFPGRYVITWNGVAQAEFNGSSTFQVVLYEDGRIAFIYKKINCRSSLIGISGALPDQEPQPIDLSKPPDDSISGGMFELFSNKNRLDYPAVTRAFYRTHPDDVDFIYIWTDFQFDNGLGLARAFNVRNDISGIGLKLFDHGSVYGSPARLATIITMGDTADWPAEPFDHVAGIFSGIGIVCHEVGHRWLAYVRFDQDHDIKDDLLGRDLSHWSFLVDSRSIEDGGSSSVMEGNAWHDAGNGTFTTIESSADYFSELDQYLMGLRPAEDVGKINFLVVEDPTKSTLRTNTPALNYSVGAVHRQTSVGQIAEREGPRVPDFQNSPHEFRVAFILVTEQGSLVSAERISNVDRYRRSLVRYFSTATNRRGSLDAALSHSSPE
ncbi:MAG TPA: hypothetical protein VGV87_15855 [Blastocatellia bacterium]|nr:hypothetical protein [Blastocatellia bacterium]